jgi:hypothetical protein
VPPILDEKSQNWQPVERCARSAVGSVPVTVAVLCGYVTDQFKTSLVFRRSNTSVVGSNPMAGLMHVRDATVSVKAKASRCSDISCTKSCKLRSFSKLA